jgi:hypothetical protein
MHQHTSDLAGICSASLLEGFLLWRSRTARPGPPKKKKVALKRKKKVALKELHDPVHLKKKKWRSRKKSGAERTAPPGPPVKKKKLYRRHHN